jgi:hypothetical protein
MSNSILLLPFIFAFLTFVLRFYVKENAGSMASPSFLLAATTVLIAGLYLFLGIISSLPPYSTIGFGLVGLVLFGVSILRMFIV